jgi:hypothetical protein
MEIRMVESLLKVQSEQLKSSLLCERVKFSIHFFFILI